MNLPRLFRLTIIILFVIIVLLPILFMLVSPFLFQDTFSQDPLFDQRSLSLGKNSLLLATGTTTLSLIIGVPLAFFFSKTDLVGRRLMRMLYLVPILIPPYIHAIVWNRLSGQINHALYFDIHSLPGAIFVLTLSYFPFVTVMTISGLKSIDCELEEASLVHHGPLRTVRGVTLPLSSPHILCGALFVFIFCIIDFGVPDILRVRVYPVEIFIQFSAFYDEKAASILSFPLILLTLIMVLIQKWHMKDRSYVNLGSGKGKTIIYNLGGYHPLALTFCIIVFVLSIFLPIAVLLRESSSLANYLRVIRTSIDQISHSLLLAIMGGLATVALAFPISYMIERSKGRGKLVFEFASLIPFAIPAVTLGIGLIKVWNRPFIDWIYSSPLIIIIAYVAHFIPFSTRATSSGIKQISSHLEEVASLSTKKSTKIIRKIVLPLASPSLVAGFFIAFVLSFGELGTTLLVIPPGQETIPIKIYNLMHYGSDQMVAALSLILIGILVLLSAIFLLSYKLILRGLNVSG